MNHVNLDTQDEAIKQFVLGLSVDRDGSVLELNGRALVCVLPVTPEDDMGAEEERCLGTAPHFVAERSGMTPAVEQAHEAFRAALPELLRQHSGEWVAYSGTRQLGFGKTKTELFQHCLRQGLSRGEFIVRCIEPESDDQIG